MQVVVLEYRRGCGIMRAIPFSIAMTDDSLHENAGTNRIMKMCSHSVADSLPGHYQLESRTNYTVHHRNEYTPETTVHTGFTKYNIRCEKCTYYLFATASYRVHGIRLSGILRIYDSTGIYRRRF